MAMAENEELTSQESSSPPPLPLTLCCCSNSSAICREDFVGGGGEDQRASHPTEEMEEEGVVYSAAHIALSSAVVTGIMAVIVTGNVLVIVSVAVDRSLRGTQNWFIASLAVSDLLVGLFIMPLSLANELMGHWVFGGALCQLWLSTDVLLCTASILNLVLISLDRYWTITRSVSYVRTRTRLRAGTMIGVVWALSMVVCFPPLVGWSRPQPRGRAGLPLCVLSEEPGYVVYSTVGSFYLPLVVMVIVYFKIYLVARRHARRHRNKYGDGGGQGSKVNEGMSQFSAKNTTNVTRRNRLSTLRMRHANDDDDDDDYDNSRVSQVPEIGSDMSDSSLEEAHDGGDQQPATKESRDHLSVLDRHYTGAPRNANTTDSQGETPTRLLLPDANGRSELQGPDRPTTASGKSGVSHRTRGGGGGSRRARAKSLPPPPPPPPPDGAGKDTNHPSSSSWSSSKAIHPQNIRRSHRRHPPPPPPPSSGRRDLELNDLAKVTTIPIIRIDSDSRDVVVETDLEEGPRKKKKGPGGRERDSLFCVFATTTTTRRPPAPPPSAGVSCPSAAAAAAVGDQHRLRRRRAARLKERRATLILGIVVASFVGCWLPFFSLYPVSLLVGFEVPAAVFAFIFWLGYVNSALNPIIYTIFNREFRQAFKRLLWRRKRKP